MNDSGRAVAAVCQFYQIPPEDILVAHDELDIPSGSVRLKEGGGHGGHNGLRDIINHLSGNKQFHRLRIGIGHPGNSKQVHNYVLSPASKADQKCIDACIDEAIAAIPQLTDDQWQQAMHHLHSYKP